MKFTAHNILLNNGEKTMGNDTILLGDSAVWKSILQSLDLFLPGTREERSKLRVVDLGCLEGGYAAEFAKLGFDTLGIEAREENIQKCNYVKEKMGLSNLNFAKDDVRNMPNYGRFDVVLCYGLLYHLNDPVDFLKIVSDCTNKLMFLNTHFAPEFDIHSGLSISIWLVRFKRGPGYWRVPKTTDCRLSQQLIKDVGFKHVFEQFDYTGDLFPNNYTAFYNRTMFLGVKG